MNDRPPFRLSFRPLLISGTIGSTHTGAVMLIDSEQPPLEQAIAVWHETLHLLFLAASKPQDEDRVEAMAQRLADACPEIVALLRGAIPEESRQTLICATCGADRFSERCKHPQGVTACTPFAVSHTNPKEIPNG